MTTQIIKGSEDYKRAGSIANTLTAYAAKERWANNSFFDIAFNYVGRAVYAAEKLGGFASEVAATIDKSMNPYGHHVANISPKQAWIIACALVQNNIDFEN